MPTHRRRRYTSPPTPPGHSQRLYVHVAPAAIGMFRFLLEAQDNLGYMSVVNKFDGILQVVFSPHQAHEMHAFLESMQEIIPFSIHQPPRC